VSDDTLLITGGIVSINACAKDCRAMAMALRVAIGMTRDCQKSLRRAAQFNAQARSNAAGNPCTSPQASAARARARDAIGRAATPTAALAAAATDLATALAATAQSYEQAEAEATKATLSIHDFRSGLLSVLLKPLPGPIGALVGTVAAAQFVAMDALAARLAGKEVSFAELVRMNYKEIQAGLSPMALTGTWRASTADIARGTLTQACAIFGEGLNVWVTRVDTAKAEVPHDLPDIINGLRRLTSDDDDRERVSVTKATAADGTHSWVVLVPGTQSMSLGSPGTAFDMATNLLALVGDVNAVGLGISAALRDAGVKKGEPILMAGHSQGGIVTTALACDKEFLAKYSVAGVMSVGSPVGLLPVAGGVPVLSLEHKQDVIPALSGGPNKAASNHTTVVRDLTKAEDPKVREAAGQISKAHALDTYLDTAKATQNAKAPSVEAWLKAVEVPLGEAVSVERMDYTITRMADDAEVLCPGEAAPRIL
jgi:hypothetical protein